MFAQISCLCELGLHELSLSKLLLCEYLVPVQVPILEPAVNVQVPIQELVIKPHIEEPVNEEAFNPDMFIVDEHNFIFEQQEGNQEDEFQGNVDLGDYEGLVFNSSETNSETEKNKEKDEAKNENQDKDKDLNRAIVVYESGKEASGSQAQNEDKLFFDIEKEIDESMKDVEAMFHTLFPDHNPDKVAETQEDESDPDLLFEDIEDEANLLEKFIYVNAQGEEITGIDSDIITESNSPPHKESSTTTLVECSSSTPAWKPASP
ncbi:hypothetical protein L1987_20109 [Smallanthus sonchifolius]|uniref:Uncharacterized protein n=1 Tax=Smallanthus sonchifolius TaxID=185202 RepID=A0ACB9IS58_9ASTR|nr:hypothetical protein L1987_20109 [Smallanthus sonchifolius]